MKKRVVIIGDLHSGHRAGLTPRQYFPSTKSKNHDKIRKETWMHYTQIMDDLKPIDILVVNGDSIDGKGSRSAGTELVTTDIKEQCDIACDCIKYAEAKKIIIIRGTPYHGSPDGQDAEDHIAEKVNAVAIGDHEWIDVNGVVFDIKHKIGNTNTHNKGTPIAKEQLANLLWHERQKSQPKADIIIRSHVHNFYYIGNTQFLGITTPALQAAQTKFGARQCIMPVDWGVLCFDIKDTGEYAWKWLVTPLSTVKAKALKL